MRVFTIVGLLLIATVAFAATKEKSVEQTQRDDALATFVYTLAYHAEVRICKEVKTEDAKDVCRRNFWVLYREVYMAQKRTGAFNHRFHRFCKWLLPQIRDRMIEYGPKEE